MKKIINCADKISLRMKHTYSNFSCMLLNPNIFFQFSNSSNLLYLRNLQEQVKQAFCYQKLFWPFTVWINCSNDLKNFANSRPSASNFKSFSRSLEQFFLTVGQNNVSNKIPILMFFMNRINFAKMFSYSFLKLSLNNGRAEVGKVHIIINYVALLWLIMKQLLLDL